MTPNIADQSLPIQSVHDNSVDFVSNINKKPNNEKMKENIKFKKEWFNFQTDIKYTQSIIIILLHLGGIYSIITFPYIKHWKTFAWACFLTILGGFGTTGGVHRCWSHRAYKAITPMRILLAICYLSAGQNSIYNWVRDHRVHHKYSDTNADPHNITRGLFFSHVGWLMVKKHPEVIRKGNQIDMTDIKNDCVVTFCEKYFTPLKILFALVIPITVPMIFWNESFYYAALIQLFKYIYVLNMTWSVNSFAHYVGNKPYDKKIAPVENKFVSLVTYGEGWHNYHHVFPMDYRAAELGGDRMSLTTRLIDLFAKIGWAYDLHVPSESLVKMTIKNRGDGTHESLKSNADHLVNQKVQ